MACARAPDATFAVHISNFACLCVYVVIVTGGTEKILSFFFLDTDAKHPLPCMFSFPPSCFCSWLSQEFKKELKPLMELTVLIFGTVRL